MLCTLFWIIRSTSANENHQYKTHRICLFVSHSINEISRQIFGKKYIIYFQVWWAFLFNLKEPKSISSQFFSHHLFWCRSIHLQISEPSKTKHRTLFFCWFNSLWSTLLHSAYIFSKFWPTTYNKKKSKL